ncbi:hypothetical protein NLM27_25755 [Bradyrhizobium sp. CCGB12]|nr:hypothetical protein [Bradyrhizobium sp. CCGB12]MCP3392190.1 hypothetical protein [Bradyrhizobium sp. CCGB12]
MKLRQAINGVYWVSVDIDQGVDSAPVVQADLFCLECIIKSERAIA